MKHILFDFGGTLDSEGTTWLERFYLIYREEGLAEDRETFDRAFYRSDDGLAAKHALAGLGLEETLSLQVQDVLEALAPDQLSRKERLVSRFLNDCRGQFRRNRPVLERLARKYSLGIVSNFYGNLDACLRAEGLRELFGAVADSGALGVEKPAQEIFLHAAKALGGAPADCLMVGDSIPRDMRGAEALKMAHALLKPASGKGGSCCPSAWPLSSLADLEARLS